MPFTSLLVQRKMQTISSRTWTRLAVSISYDNNCYTMHASHEILIQGYKDCTEYHWHFIEQRTKLQLRISFKYRYFYMLLYFLFIVYTFLRLPTYTDPKNWLNFYYSMETAVINMLFSLVFSLRISLNYTILKRSNYLAYFHTLKIYFS